MEKPIKQLADKLYEAEMTRQAIKPLTEMVEDLNVDDAYNIQLCNIDRCLNLGYKISGKKIGLTSLGIQKQLGVDEPDYGHLFEEMECKDEVCHIDNLIQSKIEGEVAFVLKEDLTGGNVTVQDVKRATDYVVAAFEIVDSRVADWKIKLVDTISDNASSGRYVLGKNKVKLEDIDLPNVEMILKKNGEVIATGKGDAVLGDPCLAVAWLANRLYDYGVILKKGEVILSGAFSAAPEAKKGDLFEAEFSNLGNVKCEFI